ncbi:MFS transporter [Lichenicoccus sp.]|uniref:MFS transporter n=1 Tax=Lichenicoccus sp. TaxID=2781899 RepID=UPI003D1250C5
MDIPITAPVDAQQQALMDRAVKHLVAHHSPNGTRVGWLMIASILVEAWDLYSIAFVLIFLREQFHPSPALLGLAGAGTQGGAIVGSLLGGWLSDRIGRRAIFLTTMVMFVVFALAQAFVPGMIWLVVVRLILGIPLGSDISNGYTYIMEFLPKGEREVMGNRWQFMFAVGEVFALALIAVLLAFALPHWLVWRLTLGFGAVPAAIIFALRYNLPETAIWLIRRGRFREAKQVSAQMYHDPLDFLPDQDIVIAQPRARDFFKHIWRDPIRRRATLFGWISCFAQGSEFSTFAFYIPVLFVLVGVSSVLGTDLVTMLLYMVAAISGWVGPLITPRIGQRGLSISGFGIVLVSLLVAGYAIKSGHTLILPFAAAVMLWGHYWDAENGITIASMMARPEYRGVASGVAYIFVKLPSFLAIFLFPVLFSAIGHGNATLFVAIFPLIGLLAAIFLLPEVYGYDGD